MGSLQNTLLRNHAVAAICGLATYLVLNLTGVAWIHGSMFESEAFRDGSCLVLTQLFPALASGLCIGFLTPLQGGRVGLYLFTVLMVVGFFFHFWRIPYVSARSAHSGMMHYFLYNPLVAWCFGSAGAWVGERFRTGEFSLNDNEKIVQQGDD